MKRCNWWALLPPVYALSTAAGLWLVYFVAVYNENVTPLMSHTWRGNGSLYPPYISIAGNFPPASCIFSEVMNLSAFGGCVLAVLRHQQLAGRPGGAWLNHCTLAAFVLACVGMTILGNFQLFPQENIHNLGTFMTFGLGTLYCWLQSFLSLTEGAVAAAAARLLLSTCITLCLPLYFVLMAVRLHMHAARCQWALVSFLLIFISTFGLDFRHSSFHILCVDAAAAAARPLRQSDADDDPSEPPQPLNHL